MKAYVPLCMVRKSEQDQGKQHCQSVLWDKCPTLMGQFLYTHLLLVCPQVLLIGIAWRNTSVETGRCQVLFWCGFCTPQKATKSSKPFWLQRKEIPDSTGNSVSPEISVLGNLGIKGFFSLQFFLFCWHFFQTGNHKPVQMYLAGDSSHSPHGQYPPSLEIPLPSDFGSSSLNPLSHYWFGGICSILGNGLGKISLSKLPLWFTHLVVIREPTEARLWLSISAETPAILAVWH